MAEKRPCRVVEGLRRGLTLAEIAETYGMSEKHVRAIATRLVRRRLAERERLARTMSAVGGDLHRSF